MKRNATFVIVHMLSKSLKPVSAIHKLCFSTSKPTYLGLFANKEYLHFVEEKQ